MKSSAYPILCQATAWLLTALACAAPLQAADCKPNFIFVIADDHRWDAMAAVQREHGEKGRTVRFHMDLAPHPADTRAGLGWVVARYPQFFNPGNTVDYFNTYILESDLVAGPWKLVTYLKHFGQQAYFVNIPSKFISKDGRAMWLCYSANFAAGWGKADIQSRPEGSKYAMCLQEIKLLGR